MTWRVAGRNEALGLGKVRGISLTTLPSRWDVNNPHRHIDACSLHSSPRALIIPSPDPLVLGPELG